MGASLHVLWVMRFRSPIEIGNEGALAPPNPALFNEHFPCCLEQDMGTLMCVDHMKRTHGVMPEDVRYYLGATKGGVRQEKHPILLNRVRPSFLLYWLIPTYLATVAQPRGRDVFV